MCVFYRWIAGKISEILGSEDDVVIELCFNLIEGSRYVGSFHVMTVCLLILPLLQPLTSSCPARHQVSPDPADRFPRQGHCAFLQGAVEPLLECPDEPSRRPQGAARGQEARAHTREGKQPDTWSIGPTMHADGSSTTDRGRQSCRRSSQEARRAGISPGPGRWPH